MISRGHSTVLHASLYSSLLSYFLSIIFLYIRTEDFALLCCVFRINFRYLFELILDIGVYSTRHW